MVTINRENLDYWQEHKLEYLRYIYSLSRDSVVVDVGAYRGEWSKEINRIYGCETVISFEPTNNIDFIQIGHKIRACAWTEDGMTRTNGAFYYTSMIHDNEVGLTAYPTVDIMKHLPKWTDILKMNIEGAEYDLLLYMIAKGAFENIGYLQVQFHETDKFNYQWKYENISKQLRRTHGLMWRVPNVWESWKRKREIE